MSVLPFIKFFKSDFLGLHFIPSYVSMLYSLFSCCLLNSSFWMCLFICILNDRNIYQVDKLNCFFFFFNYLYFLFFHLFLISWGLITLQYCSGFCHTLTCISHGFTCVPHPEPHSHLSPHPIPLGHPSAPAPSTCLMHPTWTAS